MNSEQLDPFFETPQSARKGTIDIGLDGLAMPVNLEVEERFIRRGLDIVSSIVAIAAEEDISDIHARTDRYIYIATPDGLKRLEEHGRLDTGDVIGILLALVYNRDAGIAVSEQMQQRERESLARALTLKRKVDFSCEGGIASLLSHDGSGHALKAGRMRVQCHFSATGIGVTCRILREKIMTMEETGLPLDVISAISGFVGKKSGLCFVTGATGSGKTTTLAAVIDYVRRTMKKHIVTVEDPIEYHYPDTVAIKSGEVPADTLITQQEVGRDVHSFQQGLEDALRKKPDIILLGEVRDAKTMETCLEAAQTGHLVLTTLHTRGAVKTLARILEFFPDSQHTGILSSLAESLLFICSQGLLTPASGHKRHLAVEFFQNTSTSTKSAVRGYIEKTASSLDDIMNQKSNVRWDASLRELWQARKITEETYREYSTDASLTTRNR